MAVVSLPVELEEMERNQSVRSNASSGSLRKIEEVEEDVVMEDKVYVALGKEFKKGKSTLIWALNNIDGSKKVVILHVHRPVQRIPMMGAKFPASQLKEAQVRGYRLMETEKMVEALDEYIRLCTHAKVRAEKLVIEMDDVSKGIVELIALHGIQKLVMGAAADRRYSKKMKKLRSTTAMNVQQQAGPICKIWFVCKENLIYTREAGFSQYSIPQSPATRISSSNFLKTLILHSLAKASENLYTRELRQRKEIEEVPARQRIETEELKNERDNIIVSNDITDSNCTFNELKEKLSQAQHLLNSLQLEYHELKGERDNAVREVEELRQRVVSCSEFSYSEIQQATHNFSDSMKIGEGGYGSVYKGFLRHTMVAIKVLKQESMQGQAEFHQEVEVLTKIRHPHLVTLIGVCSEAWALVYEYCINGSLEDRLACKDNTAPLTWQIRTRIATEICLALIFLHSHKPLSVVHGDLKTANILIDANMVSKLGDFGICRLLAESTNTNTAFRYTHPKGTPLYMDPEFLASGELTPLSDVYSFGIILLRLLTGKAPFGLTKEVQRALSENCLESVLDPTAGDWPFVQARQLTRLALRCCEIKRKKRPNLSLEAWKVLEPMTKAASLAGSSSMSLGSGVEDNSNIPSYFVCPIFQEIMSDPHIAADGFTYEAEALKGWLDGGHDTSPMTNIQLPNQELIPNRALRSAIQEWQQRHT